MSAAGGRLPSFFIVGAQKCGTTTLHRLLQAHPQAFLCDPKEPNFFSSAPQWARGVDWYASLFAGSGNALVLGEASTTYSMYPHYDGVVDRLTSVIAEPKVVYLTREPIARMRSAYQHALAWGAETRPIDQALLTDPRYLLTSSYALQIEQWLRRVPRDRILLLDLEAMRANPGALLAEVSAFLGIDAEWRPPTEPTAENPSAGKRAPRRWWRAVGEGMLRHEKAHWAPQWMVRLNQSDSPLVRRHIPTADLNISPDVKRSLRRALAADATQLRTLWPERRPSWLQDESV